MSALITDASRSIGCAVGERLEAQGAKGAINFRSRPEEAEVEFALPDAALSAWLASDDADGITGQHLLANGEAGV